MKYKCLYLAFLLTSFIAFEGTTFEDSPLGWRRLATGKNWMDKQNILYVQSLNDIGNVHSSFKVVHIVSACDTLYILANKTSTTIFIYK